MTRLQEVVGRDAGLLPDPLTPDPMPILRRWYDEALAARHAPRPEAMALATSTPDGDPSVRIVLCKDIDVASGSVGFYTNFDSPKSRDLEATGRAAAVFHWDHAGRQARVHGPVHRSTDADSDHYFATRVLLSRLGAWASAQSDAIESRDALVQRLADVMDRFGVGIGDLDGAHDAIDVPRPPNWGGYHIVADAVELWVNAEGRLHDRARWTRSGDGPWRATRIQP